MKAILFNLWIHNMARKKEVGLDYFPFDINFFQDIKIRKLIKYQSGKAVAVYALLLCLIYKSGYYMRWDKELPFIISERTGFDEAYILEVIRCCMTLGLLSKELYDKEKILTSKGIQEQYNFICKQAKRKNRIVEYSLIVSDVDTDISSEEKVINSEEIKITSEEMTQSKVKESKYKETTLSSSKEKPNSIGLIAINDLCEKLVEDSEWLRFQPENIYRQTKKLLSNDDVLELIENYVCKLKAEGVSYKSLDDAMMHFPNWAVKVVKSQENGNNRSSYTSKQEANAYALGLLQQHKRELEEGLADKMERPF